MTDKDDGTQKPNIQADNKSVAVGSIAVGGSTGDINIHAGDIGYSVEEVSVLITQITSTFQPKPFDGRSPYKGLDVFDEEDAELFFGREKLVEDLVSRVKNSRTLFVTGPSGSGKSSLVRAGLIPVLKQGEIKNSERWLYETLTPGRDPIGEVARVASGLASSTNAEDEIRAKSMADETIFARWCEIALKDSREKRAVIFIDQFEEVFTQINKEERLAFLNLLTHAATVDKGRVIILFSMRSDFVSNCATYPKLNALLSQQFIQIGSMQPEELVSAIAQPALRVGLRIDPDLIAQIINDMRGEPGALPLMQFALKDLFDSRQEKGGLIALTLGDYLERGGIHKSLERHADHAFARLSEKEQELAHSIFGGLIQIGRGTQDTRRITPFDELIPASSNEADVQAVLQKLADARLITTDEKDSSKYTITHEKLIDAWPWLKKLVNENRDVIALQNEIAGDAKEWDTYKRDPSYLYTGARLIGAREHLESKKLVLSGLAQEFVQAGMARQRRGQLVWIAGISTIILLLFSAVLIFSSQSRDNANLASTAEAASTDAVAQQKTAEVNAAKADEQSKIALARQLASQAQPLLDTGGSKKQTAVLLAIEAMRVSPVETAARILLDNKLAKPISQMAHEDWVEDAVFSPDSKYVASASEDNTARIWEVKTGKEISRMTHQGEVNSVAFSPNGKYVVSASEDGTTRLWESATGKQVAQFEYEYAAYHVAFSANGNYVVSIGCDQKNSADQCTQYSARVWQAKTGKAITRITYSDLGGSAVFSPDGKYVAVGRCEQQNNYGFCTHGSVRIVETETGDEISHLSLDSGFETFEFSPDGIYIVSTGCAQFDEENDCAQGSARVWETATGKSIARMDHDAGVWSFAFSPDSKYLVTGTEDGTARLWEVATGKDVATIAEGAYMNSVAFSPDGRYIASGGCAETIGSLRFACARGSAQVWDIAAGQEIARTTYDDEVSSVDFSPDSQYVLSVAYGTASVLVAATGQEIARLTQGVSHSFSPDGSYVISTAADIIRIWDADWGNEFTRITLDTGVTAVALSPDGKYIASGSWDGTARVWEAATGKEISRMTYVDAVHSIAFSRDGTYIVSAGCDKLDSNHRCMQSSARVWEAKTGKKIARVIHERITAVAFSPDGKTVVSGGCDQLDNAGYHCYQGSARVWEAATGKEIARMNYDRDVTSVAFSQDGTNVVSSGGYDVAIVWEATTGKEISRGNGGYTAVFSPDDKYVLSDDSVWEATTGEKIVSIDHANLGPSSPVIATAFSPDGRYVISGGGDGMATIWEVATGKAITSVNQSSNSSGSDITVAFSPDGKYVVSGNSEGIIRIWDSFIKDEIARMTQRDPIQSIQFSSDGKYIVSTSGKAIRMWALRPDDLIADSCSRVTSNLTHEEWIQYIGDVLPYQPVCPNVPLDFEYIKEIARDALSNADDPTRIKTALEQAQAELRKVEAVKDPVGEALRIISPILLEQMKTEVRAKDLETTLDFLEQAGEINIEITPKDQFNLQRICRDGSFNGYGKEVLRYCELAVSLAPSDVRSHDSRGMARALAGDYNGAILDFQFFVDHNKLPGLSAQRKQWIEKLKSNLNPFTPEVLEALQRPPATPTSLAPSPIPTFTFFPSATASIVPAAQSTPLPCPVGTLAPSNGLININTASACELDMLPGINPTTSQNIVDYREQNGPFLTIEDIINVSGIGPSTFDRIKDLITVSP